MISKSHGRPILFSCRTRTHSKPANTPSAPSNMPPWGTVSRCDPTATILVCLWAADFSFPITLVAASMCTSNPASFIRSVNHSLAAISASDRASRVTPRPLTKPILPNSWRPDHNRSVLTKSSPVWLTRFNPFVFRKPMPLAPFGLRISIVSS